MKALRGSKTRMWLLNTKSFQQIQKRAFTQTQSQTITASTIEAAKAPEDDKRIIIRVRDVFGEETFFKIKKTTKMRKLFQAYADREGVQLSFLSFIFNGERIEPDQTPKMIGLNDQDQIDCTLDGW